MQTLSTKRKTAEPLRTLVTVLLGSAVAVSLASSCAPRHRAVASTESVTTVDREALPAPRMIDISIVSLHDEPTVDPATEKVVGTVVNDGDRPVSRIAIRIHAVDADGNVVRTVTTPPLSQTIDAYGGRATFEAVMPRDTAVAGYRAVAIAR